MYIQVVESSMEETEYKWIKLKAIINFKKLQGNNAILSLVAEIKMRCEEDKLFSDFTLKNILLKGNYKVGD